MRLFLLLAITGSTVLSLLAPSPGFSAPPQRANYTRDIVPFLKKHCYRCHGNGKKRAGLALDQFKTEESLHKNRKVWENVQNMIRTGEMPPRSRPRPTAAEVTAVLTSIHGVLANFDCSRPRNVGRVTIRRLNRTEYNNTIRDLVGVDFKPARDFPSDEVGYGFDNIGDVLSLSPLLLEKYLTAAESILDQAIVIVDPPQPARRQLPGLRVSPRTAGERNRRFGPYLQARGQVYADSFLPAGDYTIRAEVYGLQAGDTNIRVALRAGRKNLKEFELKGEDWTTLEAKKRLTAGTHRIAVSLLNPLKRDRVVYIRRIEVNGPFNPPPPTYPETHRQIMAPGERTGKNLPPHKAAKEIITRFASRAFRRPVKAAEVNRYLGLYDRAEKAGLRFEKRIRLALCGVLVSPHFLFRIELDPPGAEPGKAYPVNEYELASRLSYFLWSSMPDEQLFQLASKGQLRKNLEAQVKRMLQDPRSAGFVKNFAGQWLTLRNLASIKPDRKQFPNFDEALRLAMTRETELFFETVLRENRSILDFIDADFSFVNERLARHYGMKGIEGKEFRRVKLPANRGGILTHASILTLTSNPTRTSPVKRGKWVLEQILNTPPPPPPPNVPELSEQKELKGSLRKQMEMHRKNAICASCHARMDPIGFAFENFNAIGAWRTSDGKFPIDPSGVLPDGKSFKGPGELKAILKEKKDLFSLCLIEKTLTYALGRGLEYYDRCAVERIHKAIQKDNYRFATLLMEVVKSDPFQKRTAVAGKRIQPPSQEKAKP